MRDRAQIKEIAKAQFKQRYGMSVAAALLFALLAGGEQIRSFTLRYDIDLPFQPWTFQPWMYALLGILAGVASVMFVVYILIGAPLKVGHAHFSRCIYNNWITSVKDMFSRTFADYGRNLGGMLWRDLFTFLWSLLFVIPGIVKAYAYFAAPYILAEFPAVRATDAIKLSMRMTYGFKADLFVLDLSFIGWNLLSGLTLGLLGILYVNPYYYTSKAGFYEELKNNAINTGTVGLWELMGYPPQQGGM
jgi:uncharacterized membrane protein